MAKLSLAYVIFFEWLFALTFGISGFLLVLEVKDREGVLIVSSFIALAALSVTASVLLSRHARWAWEVSMAFGVFVAGLGVWVIWLAAHASPYGDGGEAGIFGIGFLLFGLPGLVLLGLAATRRYLSLERAGVGHMPKPAP